MNQSEGGDKAESKTLVLLICFGLASVFWLLSALSKDHIAVRTIRLQWDGIPENQTLIRKLPDEADLRVKGNGWQLFYGSFRKKNVSIDLSKYTGRSLLLTDYNHELFAADLPSNFELLDISPDSIYIETDKIGFKTVPIRLSSDFIFDQGFGLSGPIELVPDSVVVSGPAKVLEALKSWKTAPVKAEGINEPQKGHVRLVDAGKVNLQLNLEEVGYVVPVSAYTEGSVKVDIRNIFKGKSNVLHFVPAQATVRFQAPLHIYDDIETGDFIVEADVKNIELNTAKTLKLKLISSPHFVRNTQLIPDRVEYYYLNRQQPSSAVKQTREQN